MLAIAPRVAAGTVPSFCERERCPFAVVGVATEERQLRWACCTERRPGRPANLPVDMPMDVLLGKPPKMHRDVTRMARQFGAAGP